MTLVNSKRAFLTRAFRSLSNHKWVCVEIQFEVNIWTIYQIQVVIRTAYQKPAQKRRNQQATASIKLIQTLRNPKKYFYPVFHHQNQILRLIPYPENVFHCCHCCCGLSQRPQPSEGTSTSQVLREATGTFSRSLFPHSSSPSSRVPLAGTLGVPVLSLRMLNWELRLLPTHREVPSTNSRFSVENYGTSGHHWAAGFSVPTEASSERDRRDPTPGKWTQPALKASRSFTYYPLQARWWW